MEGPEYKKEWDYGKPRIFLPGSTIKIKAQSGKTGGQAHQQDTRYVFMVSYSCYAGRKCGNRKA